MRSKEMGFIGGVVAAVLLAGLPVRALAQDSRMESGGGDKLVYEFVGQVQNFAPAGPGLPATSIQYGYVSHADGLSDAQIYLPGVPQNEASALLTFYNDSVTEKVTIHGSLRIVIREGTTTIYLNAVPGGDFTTPNPDSFRHGTPVLVTRWRHQVILDGVASPDPSAPPRTNLFFVTWWHTVMEARRFTLGDDTVRLGRVGQTLRQHLVGGVDFSGRTNGKFAGYVVGAGPASVHHEQ